MIHRVDIKTPYNQRYHGWHDTSSNKKSYNKTSLNNINKPLQGSAFAQISFKGLNLNEVKNSIKPIIKKVPKNLTEKVFQSLEKVSEEQYKYYTKIREDYVNFIKNSSDFRKKYGFTEEIASTISSENLYYRPKKKILMGFLTNIVSPFVTVGKGIRRIFLPKNSPSLLAEKEQEKVMNAFGSLEGLLNSHEIWENGYRKMSGHKKWSDDAEFLIPDDVLLNKIKRRRNKVVDPDKGKYSTTSLMLGNRFISGMVYAYFLGNDAYNTTMRYSDDKAEAANQRKSRISQEFSRIGLNMYIQNLLFGTFEAAVNKSLPTALFVSGSTVACSEILGRKLVGKPIMPSDKETLDRLEKEMENKKGVLPAIGRMLTRVKKKSPSLPENNYPYKPQKANTKVFSEFAYKKTKTAPSFKGYYSVDKMFDKKRLTQILKMLQQSDKKQYDYIKENIVKSLRNSKYLQNVTENAEPSVKAKLSNLSYIQTVNLSESKEIDRVFTDILKTDDLKELPIGTKKTVWGQLTKSILVPFNFMKNIFMSAKNSLQKFYLKFSGRQKYNAIENMAKTLKSPDFKYTEEFKKFCNDRLKLKVWQTSNYSEVEKKIKLFEEFMESLSKEPEEIEGCKNILLWLDRQISRANISLNEDGTLTPQDIEKVQNIMKESVLTADGAKQVEYDGNKLAQTNINLARAITTLFLVTDAYNLTMQYSNDNKKDANKSAKNRAAQEISRISFSAYILAFVHNLLSKLCNSSLVGAFGLTAMTSVINDSISRSVVGVPLTAKTQEQLLEIDEENSKSKSPIKKALAYSLGKKTSSKHKNITGIENNYFTQDFFINPTIS